MASMAAPISAAPVFSRLRAGQGIKGSASRDCFEALRICPSFLGCPSTTFTPRNQGVCRKARSLGCRAQAKKGAMGGLFRAAEEGGGKKANKIEKLDVNKVSSVEKYQVFARLEKDKDDLSRFKPIAELLVESGSDVPKAIKERRRQLVELAREVIEFANCSDTGLQYAYQTNPEKGQRVDMDPTIVSVAGPLEGDSVPAILRAAEKAGLRVYSMKDGNFIPAPPASK